MLTGQDLKEYRLLSHLSLRDVARYCDISAQMIGQIETGVKNMTDTCYKEIVTGINSAKQAIALGTFEEDKIKERETVKIKKEERGRVESVQKNTRKRTKTVTEKI